MIPLMAEANGLIRDVAAAHSKLVRSISPDQPKANAKRKRASVGEAA